MTDQIPTQRPPLRGAELDRWFRQEYERREGHEPPTVERKVTKLTEKELEEVRDDRRT